MLLYFLVLNFGADICTGQVVVDNPWKAELNQLIDDISTVVAEDVFMLDESLPAMRESQEVEAMLQLTSQETASRLEPQIRRLYEILLAPVKEEVKVNSASFALQYYGVPDEVKAMSMAMFANNHVEKLFRLNKLF